MAPVPRLLAFLICQKARMDKRQVTLEQITDVLDADSVPFTAQLTFFIRCVASDPPPQLVVEMFQVSVPVAMTHRVISFEPDERGPLRSVVYKAVLTFPSFGEYQFRLSVGDATLAVTPLAVRSRGRSNRA